MWALWLQNREWQILEKIIKKRAWHHFEAFSLSEQSMFIWSRTQEPKQAQKNLRVQPTDMPVKARINVRSQVCVILFIYIIEIQNSILRLNIW